MQKYKETTHLGFVEFARGRRGGQEAGRWRRGKEEEAR